MDSVVAVILAAGMGTRMRSDVVKVLHPIAGRPMVEHVIRAVRESGIERCIVVVGHQADRVRETIERNLDTRIEFVEQREQLGTGHAVMQAAEALRDHVGHVLVTYGDTPLYRADTYRDLVAAHVQSGAAGTVLSAHFDDPHGYGRVVRDRESGHFQGIVEQKDITSEEVDRITEINTGTYVFAAPLLFQLLGNLSNDNQQGEYYLPDVLTTMLDRGERVGVHVLSDPTEALGINDRVQLAEADAVITARAIAQLQRSGVTVVDPRRTVIHPGVSIGRDTVIHPFTVIQGKTTIGARCRIGPHAVVSDSTVDDEAIIEGAVVKGSRIGSGAVVEPFVYLKPGSTVEPGATVTSGSAG